VTPSPWRAGKLNAALDAIFPSERGLAGKAEFLALLGKAFILEVQPLRTRVPPAQELQTPTRQASEGPAGAPPGGGAPGSAVGEGQAEDTAAGASNRFPTLDSQRGGGMLSRKFTPGEVTPAAFASLSQKIKESFFTAILNVARGMDHAASTEEDAAELCLPVATWRRSFVTEVRARQPSCPKTDARRGESSPTQSDALALGGRCHPYRL
jgi:hypothetical protein